MQWISVNKTKQLLESSGLNLHVVSMPGTILEYGVFNQNGDCLAKSGFIYSNDPNKTAINSFSVMFSYSTIKTIMKGKK